MSDIRLTNYPDEIDNIENMREPTEEELALIQAGNYDALTDDAKKNVFVTAEKINTMIDGLRSWQQFMKQWVEDGYVHQGTYDSTKYYYPRDVVSIGGVDYLCIGFKVRGVYPSTDTSKKWLRLTGVQGERGATGVGQKGDPAELIYIDTGGVNYIAKNANGDLSNPTLTIKPYMKTGSNSPRALSSYIYIYTKTSINGSYSSTPVQSAGSTTKFDYTVPKNVTGIKIALKDANGNELAVKEVPIIQISNSVVNTYSSGNIDSSDFINIVEKFVEGYKNREYIIKFKPRAMYKKINLKELFDEVSISMNSWDFNQTTVLANINISYRMGFDYALPLIGTSIGEDTIYVSYNLRNGFDLDEDNKFPEYEETNITSDNLNECYISLCINTVLK